MGGSQKRNRRCSKVQSRGHKVHYGLRAETEREERERVIEANEDEDLKTASVTETETLERS